MNLLEAALAFALAMIIFSTMVTSIMEVLYRLFGSREKIFLLTMERLFDQIIWPLVRQRLPATSIDQARALFMKAITANPVEELDPKRRGFLDFGSPKGITGLGVMEFMERLASTEIGKAIAAEAEESEERLVAIVNDLTQKFSRFCKGASQRLTEDSLGYSLWMSLALAFVLNIDAPRIFHFYLEDDAARQEIIARQDKIAEDAKAAQKRLDEARKKAESGSAEDKALAQDLEKRVGELKSETANLQSGGLPIGYEMYPGCTGRTGDKGSSDTRCASKASAGSGVAERILVNAQDNPGRFLWWILSVLLGGLLVGLGAPFWFNVASGLSRSLQVMKALTGTTQKKDSETDANQPAQASGVAPPPRTPVEAFTTALAALPKDLESGDPSSRSTQAG